VPDRAGYSTATFALDARCRLIADGDRLVLLTDQSAAVLRGTTTAGLIADGLALLDGSRTQQQIADTLGVPVDQWDQVVARIADRGLATQLTDLPPDAATGDPDLLHVVVDVPDDERLVAMDAARLHLLGRHESLLDALAEVWVAAGAPEPSRGEPASAPSGALWVHAALDDDELNATNASALASGSPWLQVPAYDGEVLAVGPLHVPGQTCCADCVRIRRAANAPYPTPNRSARLLTAPRLHRAPLVVRLQADLVALVAARFSLNPIGSAVGTVHALSLSSLRSSEHRVLRVPRCPSCSPARERAVPYPWTRSADVVR
jgi:bacteriocin biosynthesis cyclodehydratase domain-containing protein